MNSKLQGTKTLENLKTAFAGESMARNKYTFFASQAKREGYEQIAAIFTDTADNEKEHAKRLAHFIGIVGNTTENLTQAAAGENYEWTQMYKEFEAVAREEGFEEIANVLREIGEVEEDHEERFLKLKQNIENGTVFKSDEPVKWHCRNCGYIHEGTEPPTSCPACAHPKSFYELYSENF